MILKKYLASLFIIIVLIATLSINAMGVGIMPLMNNSFASGTIVLNGTSFPVSAGLSGGSPSNGVWVTTTTNASSNRMAGISSSRWTTANSGIVSGGTVPAQWTTSTFTGTRNGVTANAAHGATGLHSAAGTGGVRVTNSGGTVNEWVRNLGV